MALVEKQNFDDLISMRREIKRLSAVIEIARDKRRELRARTEEVWQEIEDEQMRLPYDDAEATEVQPSKAKRGRKPKQRDAEEGMRV
jgi:hypothetical protein